MTLRDQLDRHISSSLAAMARKLGGERTGKRLPIWGAAAAIRAAIMPLRFGRSSSRLPAVLDLLQGFVERTDERQGIRDDVRGVTGPGWSTLNEGRYIDEVSNAGVLLLPIAQLALYRHRNPELFDDPRKIDHLTEFAALLCRHYLAEIEHEDGHAFMRSRIDGRVEPYNHVHPYAGACGIIGHLTGDEALRDAANAFLRTFDALCFTDAETGLPWWPYRPQLAGEPVGRGEQIWKAITTLHLPLALRDVDPSVTIDPYIRLFREHIYCGRNQDGPKFQIHIGNAKRRWLLREKIREEGRRHRVQALAEWAILEDAEVERIIASAVEKRTDLFPDGWFGISRSMIGLASILERA